MPVIMSEPLTSNQRMCELQTKPDIECLLSKAAKDEDPVLRVVLAVLHSICRFNDFKYR